MTTMKKISAFAIALSLLTVPLYAALKASAVRSGNYTFAQGTSNLVPLDNAGTTQLTFSGSGKHVITYSAECAVSAAAGNAGTWLNIDIELIPNIATGVVQVLAPTAGTSDAFCTSNETAGADPHRHSRAATTSSASGPTCRMAWPETAAGSGTPHSSSRSSGTLTAAPRMWALPSSFRPAVQPPSGALTKNSGTLQAPRPGFR